MNRRFVTALQLRVLNPSIRLLDRMGMLPRGTAILETTGRKTGRLRQTPVGNGLEGDTFWLVAEHGRSSGYVRNLEANPRVRVKIGERWHPGTAHILDDEDPIARQEKMWNKPNARAVRRYGTDLLVIRIDLDEPAGA